MWLGIRVLFCRAWCKLTGADAVYVKDLDDNRISVKVMRTRFDPFVDNPEKVVRFRKYGYRRCHAGGKVSNGAWQWCYVDKDLHVQHMLSTGTVDASSAVKKGVSTSRATV